MSMVQNVDLTQVFQLLATLFQCLAVYFAYKSTVVNRNGTYAQIFMELYKEYSSPDMLGSMKYLKDWKEKHGDGFTTIFKKQYDSKYRKVKKIDECRRRVSHYFHKLRILYDEKVIDMRFAKKLATEYQIDLLLDVVEPLEKALNPNYDRTNYSWYREKVCSKHFCFFNKSFHIGGEEKHQK